MMLSPSKDGSILSKESFSASHPLGHGSLCSNKGLGCNREIEDSDVNSFMYSYRISISLTLP